MSFYVKIKRLNGRKDHAVLAAWLIQSGVVEVDYHEGGWADQFVYNLHPHLKFEREEDAVAYILANGGSYSMDIPKRDPNVESGWLG
jgi:hypothetical protein